MSYTVLQLINNAYYTSGIVARGFETVSGEQENDGLQMLNSILSIKTADQRMITYYQDYEFNGVINQEKYLIPNLILVQTLTFEINTVRYSMDYVQRKQFFGTPRANNVSSLPFQYFVERAFGGSNLYMYFSPADTYTFNLHGKFSLSNVSINQDLSLIFELYYIEYLMYSLAEFICQQNNITLQPQSALILRKLENMIFDISPLDLSIKKYSSNTSNSNGPDVYCQANLQQGWTPT